MTKRDIVKAISDQLGVTQQKTKIIVQHTLDAIISVLAEEGRIELRNFGVFEVRHRKSRAAMNPRTGKKIFVPEKCLVVFKQGKELSALMKEETRRIQEKRSSEACST